MEASVGAGELLSSVLYQLRFELVFCACALLGWLVSTAAKRSGENAMVEKKKAMLSFSETPKSVQSKSSNGSFRRESSNVLLASYRRCGPDEVLRQFDRHRKSQTLVEQSKQTLQEIFTEVYAAVIRAGISKQLPEYIREAGKLGVAPTDLQLESIVKMSTAKKTFVEALHAYDAANSADFQGTASIWSCLLFCAVEAGEFARCPEFYKKLQSLKEPSCEDFMNMIRYVVHTKQPDRLAVVLKEMRATIPTPDNIAYNRALAVCVSAEQLEMAEQLLAEMKSFDGVCDAITYNTLIKGWARAGNINRCFALHEDMLQQSITPSEVTFGILLDACISAGMVDKAAKVFKDFQASGCKLNAILYTTLLKGLAKAGQLDQAMKIFEQMCASDVTPDLVTYSVLIKVLCDDGRLESALELLTRLVQQGLVPDEIVYNNLLLGCAERKSSALGQRLLEDMQKHDICPSNVTLSIMLKIFTKCKEWDAALEALDTSYARFRLPCENRLYVQLLQSCVRERQGKRVVEVYESMIKRCPPDEATSGRLLQQCISFNMLDTGAELLESMLPPRGRVGAKDANALLSTCLKKQRVNTAKAILTTMERGRIPVDNALQVSASSI
jgi:pentatricopeptide repeat protein